MAYRNYRRGYYGYGPQARPGYDPYSKHPDWASAVREALKNMMMMKQMKEEREERAREREFTEKRFDLQKLSADLQLRNVAENKWAREKAAQAQMRLEEEAKEKLSPEEYKYWKFFGGKLPKAKEEKSEFLDYLGKVNKRYAERIKALQSTIRSFSSGVMPRDTTELEEKLTRLKLAFDRIGGLESKYLKGDFAKDDYLETYKLGSQMTRLEQFGPWWEEGKIITGKPYRKGNMIVIGSKRYPIKRDTKGEYIVINGVKNRIK